MKLLALAAVIGCALLLHLPTAIQMHRWWWDIDNTTYTHGYLIAAIAIWLLWRRRASLANVTVKPVPAAIAALLVFETGWLIASQAGIQGACMLLLPVILWLTVFSVFGRSMARLTFLPLAYLYFALPIWSLVNPIAQWSTVYATRLLLSMVGIDAFFEASLVHLQSGTFEIAGGCSGLHFIIVGLSLATLLGELRQDNMRIRLKLAGLALLFAVLTNWVRVFVIIVAGDLTHMQHYLVRVSHYGFGWALFAVAMTVFFVIESRLKAGSQSISQQPAATAQASRSWASGVFVWLATGAAVAFPMAANALISSRQQSLSVSLPAQPGPWRGPQSATSNDWQPVFVGADAERRGTYVLDGESVEVYSAWYAEQQQGKELSGFYNSVSGELASNDDRATATAGQRPFNVAEVKSRNGQTSTLWYSYAVGDRWFSNPTRAQLWYALQSLSRLQPPVSRVLAVRDICLVDCASANHSISRFLEQLQ